ncbi:MAG: D-tyrosyl-tRNA(Tyr) deacylase [Tissierellia bacterium]|nr:D-tyrosyl-tRNA(Tyr) deacylase [Tissierellia bacterium]
MRVVIQRVSEASCTIDGKVHSKIGKGLLVFFGVGQDDADEDMNFLLDKTLNLRIFEDNEGKMNLSLQDIDGEILIISQFTLYGNVKKGRRPSFVEAADPKVGEEYYNKFVEEMKNRWEKVESGVFGADMKIGLVNDGPVTILIDSKR